MREALAAAEHAGPSVGCQGPSPGQDAWVSIHPRAAAGSTHACHPWSPMAASGSRVFWLSGSAGMIQVGSPPSGCGSQPQFLVTALDPGRRAAVCASLEPAQGFWGLLRTLLWWGFLCP